MKKLFKLSTITLCLLLSLFVMTGCDMFKKETTKDTKKEEKTEEKAKSKGKCTILKCMDKLDSKSSLEDINKEIGFEGEKYQEGNGWSTYKWELNEEETVEATFFSTSTTIKIDFPDDLIKNKKVTFAKYDEIKAALNNREEVSYDKIKETFGGVEGTLVEKSSSGYKYKWVNSEGGYLNANFNLDKTRCSMIMGRI